MLTAGRKVSLAAGTTTGTGTAIDAGGWNSVSISMIGTGTITGGTILIEEADTSSYSGTWSTLTTLAPINVTGGAIQTVKLARGAYGWLRARVTSNVTGGGSVLVAIRGQQ